MYEHFQLVVSCGDVVLSDGSVAKADIGISDGQITSIQSEGALQGRSEEYVDASGLTVFPGVIDAHIHLGHGIDITRPREKLDAEAESAAAALGGVTTFLSYLISDEPYLSGDFDEVLRITAKGSLIDFSFHPVISTEEQLAEVERFVGEYGVNTFKIFMYNRGGEGKRLGLPDIDDGFLFRLLEKAASLNATVCPHCENIEVSWILRDRLKEGGDSCENGLAIWDASRPPLLEAEAVHRVSTLARLANASIHMVHCSSAVGLEAAVTQRRLGVPITIETCAQYLTHTVDTPLGLKAKVNPPIRHQADVDALWQGLLEGQIDTVATDHVHRPNSAKIGDVWTTPPGFPGLETLLPVMISEGYHKRGLKLGAIARLLSSNPARIMGLTTKGEIAIGKDADLVLVDINAEWTAEACNMHSSAGYSIYEGWRFLGKPIHTLVRGEFAMRDGSLCPERIGKGCFIKRKS